jgi:hypothetical protein
MDHKLDLLADSQGKMFALRLYLDLLIHDLVGNHPRETARYLGRILAVRYAGMMGAFTLNRAICDAPAGVPASKIPTAQHVYGDSVADMQQASRAFSGLSAERRDILLADYIEELSAQVCCFLLPFFGLGTHLDLFLRSWEFLTFPRFSATVSGSKPTT